MMKSHHNLIIWVVISIIAVLNVVLCDLLNNTPREMLNVTHLNDHTFDEFMSDKSLNPIVFQFPSLYLLNTEGKDEFIKIADILKDNKKCKFGLYETPIRIDTPPAMFSIRVIAQKDGNKMEYNSSPTFSRMLGWINFHRLCDITVNDIERVKLYSNQLEVGHVQVYVLTNQQNMDVVERAQVNLINAGFSVPILHTTNEQAMDYVLKKYDLQLDTIHIPSIMAIRNILHMRKVYFFWNDLSDDESMIKYYKDELVPSIHSTNSYMIDQVFKERKTFVYIYTQGDNLSNYIDTEWLNRLCRNNLDTFRFIHSKGHPGIEARLNKLLVIDAMYVATAVRAFEYNRRENEFIKYRPISLEDGEINQKGFSDFLSDLRKGKLSHFIKSEMPVGDKYDVGYVRTVVGENFHRRVIESDIDILILFFSPWCGHCHHAKRIFRDLGRRLSGVDSLMIATFDAFNNEVEGVLILQYPTILMYPAGAKDAPILFNGSLSLSDLAEFIERECKKKWISASSIINRELDKEQIFEFHAEL